VRRIGRDLKPVVDSFEMTTGQPVEEILCAYLPSNLNWLFEPLARVVGRTPLEMKSGEWMRSVGLESTSTFGLHWLGALSLVANLDADRGVARRNGGDYGWYHRPWHVDCSVPMGAADPKLAGRRFLVNAFAVAVVSLGILITAWQAYATYSLRADIRYWEKQMQGSRRLFDDLTTVTATLKARTGVFDRAYELVAAPFQHSNVLMAIGRTIPPRMRVDRIEANSTRISISGSLLEPAEEASATLGRHMEDIRRNPELGPLFSQVGITSLERRENTDTVTFELTLRLKPSEP
jgi:hypothetical protein